MQKMSPVDELAETRAEIARLQRREAVLLRAVPPGDAAAGRGWRAPLPEARARIPDSGMLPPRLHDNPACRQEPANGVVKCLPVLLCIPGARPGWPIQRGNVAGDIHLQ